LKGRLSEDFKGAFGLKITREGKNVVSLGYPATREFYLAAPIKETPVFWELSDGKFYEAELSASGGGKVCDKVCVPAAFADISAQGGELTVNGKAVKIKGISDAGKYPGGGPTAPYSALIKQDLSSLASLGFNVCLAEGLPEPLYFSSADKLGLLVAGIQKTDKGEFLAVRAPFSGAPLLLPIKIFRFSSETAEGLRKELKNYPGGLPVFSGEVKTDFPTFFSAFTKIAKAGYIFGYLSDSENKNGLFDEGRIFKYPRKVMEEVELAILQNKS
jgi:Beta-galactosidase/beta-glucuronidase